MATTDPTTFADTDDLIEAMRQAGWFCEIEIRPDPLDRGWSRYHVSFRRRASRIRATNGIHVDFEPVYEAGAPKLKLAVFRAAQRACKAAATAALTATEPPRAGE